MLIDNLIKAKNGDCVAANNILKHYRHLIHYMMEKYEITNKEDCYDVVIERILKSFYKFNI